MEETQKLAVGEIVHHARHEQKLSLRELASRANVSASLLSQIESGKVTPSITSLYHIAEALSLPIDIFFPKNKKESAQSSPIPTAPSNLEDQRQTQHFVHEERAEYRPGADPGRSAGYSPLLHPEARKVLELMGGITWARLTPCAEDGMEFLEISYAVGASSGADMIHHTGREFGLLLEGTLLLELGFERYELHPGDSTIFDSTRPHRLTNIGEIPVRALWVRFTRLA